MGGNQVGAVEDHRAGIAGLHALAVDVEPHVEFARVADFMRRLDGQLAGNRFIAGGRFSIADIAGLVTVDFMKWVKTGIPDDCVNVARWYAEVSRRPSARA